MEDLRVDISGRSLAAWCSGDGTPPVILETGLGAPASDWRDVHEKVAHQTRVCHYDRANCGSSDPAPTPRTARDMAEDLHALVHATDIRTPVVIAGHSFGGPIAIEYTRAWPDEVAGLVLVDPAAPDQFDKFGPLIPDQLAEMKKFWTTGWRTPEGTAERIDFPSTFDSIRNVETLGDVELIVLTSGTWQVAPVPQPHEMWVELHRRYAGLSTRSEQRVLDGDHFLQRSAPDAVAQAILDVVDRIGP